MSVNLAITAAVNLTAYELLTAKEQIDDIKLIAHNKAVIMSAIKNAGAVEAFARYKGQGESRRFTGIYLCKKSSKASGTLMAYYARKLDLKSLSYVEEVDIFQTETKVWITTLVENQVSLEKAIESFCYKLIIVSGHGRYKHEEIGDNGECGVISFKVASNAIMHQHLSKLAEQTLSYNQY